MRKKPHRLNDYKKRLLDTCTMLLNKVFTVNNQIVIFKYVFIGLTQMNVNLLKELDFKDLLLLILFVIVIFANLSDFIEDGFNQEDAWLKLLTVGLSLWGITMLIRLMKRQMDKILTLTNKVKTTENDLELTHSKLKQIGREYSIYLRKQFTAWSLTNSEKEVAILLLKGLSFKEMAELRATKVKTVRQQASSIYQKAGVAGRYEFSAWFFEDMLV